MRSAVVLAQDPASGGVDGLGGKPQANALTTAWQMLTELTEQDRIRRQRGPLVEPDVAGALFLGVVGN